MDSATFRSYIENYKIINKENIKILCQFHPNNFITYIFHNNNKLMLVCDECKLNELNENTNIKMDQFWDISLNNIIQIKNKVLNFYKQSKNDQQEHLNTLKNFRIKINSILDEIETCSVNHFDSIINDFRSYFDMDSIFKIYDDLYNLKNNDIRPYDFFYEKINVLYRNFFINENNNFILNNIVNEIQENINLLLENTYDLNNEINISTLNFLSDFKNVSLNCYEKMSNNIMKKSQYLRNKNSIELEKGEKKLFSDNIKMSKYPLEINSNTPFAKDIILIGEFFKGYLFATCSNDEKIRIWNLENNNCQLHEILTGHTDWINRLICYQELGVLISSSRDKTIRIWDIATWKCKNIYNAHTDSVFGLTFFNDLPLFASSSYDKTIKLWHFDDQNIKSSLEFDQSIYELRSYNIEDIGLSLVAGDSQGNLYFIFLINGITLKKRNKVKAHEGCILRLVEIKSGKIIASSANKDKMIKLWNSNTMTIVHQLQMHDERGVSGLFYDEFNDILISAGKDNSIKILKCNCFEVIVEFIDSFIQFGGVVWVPKNNILISCGGKKINSNVKMTLNIRYF